MAEVSLRHILQREIFTPRGERLLGLSLVWKARKKIKSSILCASVSAEPPLQVMLVMVKAGRGHHKVSAQWPAEELSLVDVKDAVKESAEFHLHLDKVYEWVSRSHQEKNAFITCLWNINQRYLYQRIQFVNISSAFLEAELLPRQQASAVTETTREEEEEEEQEGFQELTPQEAADIQRLMEESERAVSDAKAFAQALHANLPNMDLANLKGLVETEKQVGGLLNLLEKALDEALDEVELIEESLSRHEHLLHSVQEQMKRLHARSIWLQCIDRNHSQLRTELCQLVDQLTLDEDNIRVLTEGDLEDREGVRACISAVQSLSRCCSAPLTAGQRRLQGVAEQLIRFESVRQIFEQRLSQHISNVIMQQGQAHGGHSAMEDQWKPPALHRQLLQYKPLMDWLRESSPLVFEQLVKVYAQNISRLYDQQIKELFDAARSQLSGPKEARKASLVTVPEDSLASSNLAPSCLEGRLGKVVQNFLGELESLCIEEQQFLTSFFSLDSSLDAVKFHAGRRGSAVDQVGNCIKLEQKKRPHSWIRVSVSGPPPEPCTGGQDCLRAVLGAAEPSLCNLLSFWDKTEPLSFLAVLKTTRQSLSRLQHIPSTSFYCSLLLCVQQQGQHSLGTYTESLSKELESPQVVKKARAGVLPFVQQLEEFVCQGQALLGGKEEPLGLEATYTQLFKAAFHTLESLSGQNVRTGSLVVPLLNIHRLARFLAQLGLPALKEVQKEAQERTALHLRHYARAHTGRPLGSLSDFLDGVRGCLSHGVREEEVCFRLAYSKQELRKLTEHYSGSEVRRSLEAVHKRASRELGGNQDLLQAVWSAMEQDFVTHYQQFEDLITRCYPGAGISLDFTKQDLLEFFSTGGKET